MLKVEARLRTGGGTDVSILSCLALDCLRLRTLVRRSSALGGLGSENRGGAVGAGRAALSRMAPAFDMRLPSASSATVARDDATVSRDDTCELCHVLREL